MSLARRLLLATIVLFIAAAPAAAVEEEYTIVAKRVIYPGEEISADMVEEVVLDRAGRNLGPLVMGVEEIAGKVARRTILPGRLIAPSSVREPWMVEAGKETTVVLDAGALQILAKAVALANASAGDTVRMRNVDSGRIFSGVVMVDGTVRVGAQ